MNFSKTQMSIITASEPRIICLSGAAAGKTRVLTERIRHLVEVKNVKPEDIVAITFTNAAAQEMRQRLGSIASDMFIGTIHSYANKICTMNKVDTISDINKQEFDKILEKVMKIPRDKYPKVNHLLVDECQDMTLLVFDFVNKIPSENIFLVGDTRQTIYTFNGSSDSYMRAIYNSHEFKTYNLAENYRNPPNIIDYAEEFLSSNKFVEIGPKSIAIKKRDGIIEKCAFSEVVDYIAQDKNWGSWFVLTRTNAELDKALEILSENDIPCFAFRKHELDMDGVQDALLKNCVKVMTIHCCVPGYTLVPTSKGIKTIEEIVRAKDKSLLVYNGTYYDEVEEFIENGWELTYKVNTEHGCSFKATALHDCITLTDTGIAKEKVIDMFEHKDNKYELLVRKNIENYQYEEKVALKQVDTDEMHYNTIIYETPKYLTPELAELVGMITADGTHNLSSIHYNKRHKECVERFCELIKICFNKDVNVFKSSYEDAWAAECNSKYIIAFLYDNFDGINNKDKYVSSLILNASQEIQCAFLRGFFEDGTVALKKGRVDSVTIIFKNNVMVSQLQTMLFSLGIDASFTSHDYKGKDRELNYCYIYSTGLTPFKEKIGFISDFKKERLATFEQKYQRKNKSVKLKNLMLSIKDKAYIKGQSQFWSNLQNNQGLTDGIFYKYYNLLPADKQLIPEIQFIKNIFDYYQIETVTSIEECEEEETFCLSMKNEPQFIQDGFLLGNSKGLQAKNVAVIGARTYNVDERRISYVAATRAESALFWCPTVAKKGYGKSKNSKKPKNLTFYTDGGNDIIQF